MSTGLSFDITKRVCGLRYVWVGFFLLKGSKSDLNLLTCQPYDRHDQRGPGAQTKLRLRKPIQRQERGFLLYIILCVGLSRKRSKFRAFYPALLIRATTGVEPFGVSFLSSIDYCITTATCVCVFSKIFFCPSQDDRFGTGETCQEPAWAHSELLAWIVLVAC